MFAFHDDFEDLRLGNVNIVDNSHQHLGHQAIRKFGLPKTHLNEWKVAEPERFAQLLRNVKHGGEMATAWSGVEFVREGWDMLRHALVEHLLQKLAYGNSPLVVFSKHRGKSTACQHVFKRCNTIFNLGQVCIFDQVTRGRAKQHLKMLKAFQGKQPTNMTASDKSLFAEKHNEMLQIVLDL